ncbi:polyprenyl p-hydroxybenzoate/phenylacrylic acid decarboxylase [Sphaerochaeta pleomorpha str. Grapes]|uniref:Flavin prenyltransferase UbiX n=1 Tax=Sphaerochaeta pleomorpha (strain ATCC BAA-1885 / DSM 22778 / Grapes) TaxID=158190 RepID=G8QQ68_SPHPG|nr:UbiX family flavin prenyltransferase [Sphaerochaeta pleomorpha]AEV28645.1 polyprenyl p-hydroxybenzoate/phenylacrylic acid decarboxylase [Sphaerochaeta pleomorpha str. Grapes]
MKQIVVAITGATGSVYALHLLQRLGQNQEVFVHLVVSLWGERVMVEETGKTLAEWLAFLPGDRIRLHNHGDLASPLASGSFPIDAMVVIPCTMGTLGSLACGLSSNLIERAASVALKEKRPLVLVARETPLSSIHLQNMLTLSNAGAMILPPVPTFYCHPKTVDDIIDSTVDRVLDSLHLADTNTKRWS